MSPSTELALKRSAVSAADYLLQILTEQGITGTPTLTQCKLIVEDFVSRAVDNRMLKQQQQGGGNEEEKGNFALKLLRSAIGACVADLKDTIKMESMKVKRYLIVLSLLSLSSLSLSPLSPPPRPPPRPPPSLLPPWLAILFALISMMMMALTLLPLTDPS